VKNPRRAGASRKGGDAVFSVLQHFEATSRRLRRCVTLLEEGPGSWSKAEKERALEGGEAMRASAAGQT